MIELTSKTEILREKIDWIAYTQKNNVDWQFPSYIHGKWKPISPLRNYTNGEENDQGVKRFWNIVRSDQGRMVILSGTSLDMIEMDRSHFYGFVAGLDNKVTRVDYCLDIFGTKFNPTAVISHLKGGDYISHARSALKVTDTLLGGFSQYVGTKSSETYTRIYDKAAEQKVTGKWTRIETVYQGARAEASLQAYLLHKSTRPLIRAHVEFPKWKAWQRVMAGDKAKLAIQTKESNTRQWLLTSVAKSIAKELLLDDDQQFLFDLMERVRFEYKRLTKSEQDVDW